MDPSSSQHHHGARPGTRPGVATARPLPWLALVALLALPSLQCGSTPVTPARVTPEQASQIQAALVGTCEVTGTQKAGSPLVKETRGIRWTFDGKGTFHQHVHNANLGTVDSDHTYRLDGRNVVTTGGVHTMRLDRWDTDTLTFFLYDVSESYFCSRT